MRIDTPKFVEMGKLLGTHCPLCLERMDPQGHNCAVYNRAHPNDPEEVQDAEDDGRVVLLLLFAASAIVAALACYGFYALVRLWLA